MMGYLQVLGAVSIWAFFNGILVNGIKTSGVGVGTWTALVGIVTFSITFALSGIPSGLSTHHLMMLALLGIFAALNNSCYYTALKISIPNAALFHYLAPLLVIFWVLSFEIFRQPITQLAIIAVLVGLIGVFWLVGPNIREGNKRLVILGFASAIFYSLELVLSGYVSKNLGVSSNVSAFTKLLFQAMVMPLIGLALGESIRVSSSKEWPKIIAGGALLYISFVLFFRGAQTVIPIHLGILGYIDRVGAILLGCWYFRQPVTKNILIGGAFILGAGLLLIF
jgi:drug/metabolite transporter (DMT)-like permease